MTRKFTAHQVALGARAYAHNAARRAHQLSRPKAARAIAGPVGDAALNDGIDKSCEHCGYQICNCGPCATCGEVPYYCSGAHSYEPAPAMPPARAAEPAPHSWSAGDVARCTQNAFRSITLQREYAVHAVFRDMLRLTNDVGEQLWFDAFAFAPSLKLAEPAPAGRDPYEAAGHPWARVGMKVKTSSVHPFPDDAERTVIVSSLSRFDYRRNISTNSGWAASHYYEPIAPAAVDDEAVLLSAGWHENRRGRTWMKASFSHSSEASVWQALGDDDWRWAPDEDAQRGRAPTLLQAACAALGITVHELSPAQGYYAAHPDFTEGPVAYGADAESCARAALVAYQRARHG